ncbi:HAD superfamily phosphoserine phosphatase-like hydrolase [Sphingomonas zeicaulis]|uniref:HAD-IB family phosphatase n=1 Tax=Sphingomonas zeicaulis TaxID=1632740 RepID=UPI003D1CFC06
MKWTAILLAGQRPGVDPLARAFGGVAKAEVPVLGRPMIAYVVETLLASPSIGDVVVLTQDPEGLRSAEFLALRANPRVRMAEGGTGISASIDAVAGGDAAPFPILVTTADHPLLTPDIVEGFIAGVTGADLAVGMVESRTLLAAYPDSKRTWLRFNDGAWSGANLFALGSDRVRPALALWRRAEADRKQAVRLFLHFGPMLALRAITRTIGLADAIARVGRKMGMTARLVPLPQPEAAIDVDKLSDHRQVEGILAARQGGDAAASVAAAQARLAGISVFDLDKTLTRHPTYTPLLIHFALGLAPWRLLAAPVVAAVMIGHVLKLVSRRRTKEFQHRMLVGGAVARADVTRLAESFAAKLDGHGLLPAGRARIAEERAAGRRIVLATAANRYYAEALGALLGVDDIIATGSTWEDDRLLPGITGENCYGPAKREMLQAYVETLGLRRADLHVRFFSDHASDRPAFEWADEQFAVNPSRKLRKLAAQKGWPVLEWR